MEALLEDKGLKEFIYIDIPKPAIVDAQLLYAWKKKVAKARRIVLEGIRYHIVSSLNGKETPYSMGKAFVDLFQNSNNHRKSVLKDKLRKMNMEEGETVPTDLVKFTQCQDELGSVGVK